MENQQSRANDDAATWYDLPASEHQSHSETCPCRAGRKLNFLTVLARLILSIDVWHATCSLMCWLDAGTGIGQSKRFSTRTKASRRRISRILEMLRQNGYMLVMPDYS